jgi:hypothetical protein
MSAIELRDLDAARQFLVQGLWLQRTVVPTAATVKPALTWALEVAASGQPLPPIGFVADLGHVAFGLDRDARPGRDTLAVPGLPSARMREYEDHVLGKVYADWTFERAGDALRRYSDPTDRVRGLAYVVKQFRERAGFAGVELSPGVIKSLIEDKEDDTLARGWESLSRDGLMPLLEQLYKSLIDSARRTAEVLGVEDVIALEQGTALADLGQYVAHRQVLQAALRLEAGLPRQKVKPLAGRQEVPTRVLDEDTYPVGGFASISTKGSVESMLHSQLAFMEREQRPDLFDLKYLRDELYYYSRDENQFLRRRRTFLFALGGDLTRARFKDAELPWQRIVLVLALLLTAVRKLSEWLNTDALRFEFLLPADGENEPLGHERELLEMLLREQIANGTVVIEMLPAAQKLEEVCARRARRSLCHCLWVATWDRAIEAEDTVVERLVVDEARPSLGLGERPADVIEADDALECWTLTLERLLQVWV